MRRAVSEGVGGIVSGTDGVGRRPGEDYITSPLLSTSILGNLVEPRPCQSFPFPLAGTSAPPAAHHHGDCGRLAVEFIYVPGEHTCCLLIAVMLLTSVRYPHTRGLRLRVQIPPDILNFAGSRRYQTRIKRSRSHIIFMFWRCW